MTCRLTLTLADAEGALVRTLGMIERRGWRMANLACTPAGPDTLALALDIEPRDPSRSAHVLKRQIERIADVLSIDVAGEETPNKEELAS